MADDNKSAYSLEASLFKDFGIMLSGFIHDINNPIAIITGQISIMQTLTQMGKLDDEKALKVCSKVVNSTNKLSVMIDEVRAFYKPHQSDDVISDLNSTLNSILTLSATKIYRNEISFTRDENNEQININMAPKDLSIVLWNFVNFIIDYAMLKGFGTQIEISNQGDQSQVIFKVNDDMFNKELFNSQITILLATKLIKAVNGDFLVSNPKTLTLSLPKA